MSKVSLADEVDSPAKHTMNVTPHSFAEATKVRANLGNVERVCQSSAGSALRSFTHSQLHLGIDVVAKCTSYAP